MSVDAIAAQTQISMNATLARNWWTILARGLIAIAFGLLFARTSSPSQRQSRSRTAINRRNDIRWHELTLYPGLQLHIGFLR
jgi:hypothetical protein